MHITLHISVFNVLLENFQAAPPPLASAPPLTDGEISLLFHSRLYTRFGLVSAIYCFALLCSFASNGIVLACLLSLAPLFVVQSTPVSSHQSPNLCITKVTNASREPSERDGGTLPNWKVTPVSRL